MAFVKNIAVVTETQEEYETLREAVKQDRRNGLFRPSAVVLREIRSKAVRKH
jgi:hypothetical protein